MENIHLMGALYGKTSAQIDSLALEILGFTHLLPFKDRLADNLIRWHEAEISSGCRLDASTRASIFSMNPLLASTLSRVVSFGVCSTG